VVVVFAVVVVVLRVPGSQGMVLRAVVEMTNRQSRDGGSGGSGTSGTSGTSDEDSVAMPSLVEQLEEQLAQRVMNVLHPSSTSSVPLHIGAGSAVNGGKGKTLLWWKWWKCVIFWSS
jgi:hypothetical protein